MRRTTPERARLTCPVCRSDAGSHPLALGRVRRSDGDEILDGDLRCTACAQSYPVVDGVAVVARDPEPLLEHEDEQLATYLHADHAPPDLTPLPEGLRPDPDPVDLLLDHVQAGDRALDLGCGTGGALFALAGRAGFALGLDLRVSRVRALQTLRRTGRITTGLATAPGHRVPVELERSVRADRCDAIAADGTDPPLSPDDWDHLHLGKLYDVARDPDLLLGQATALLRNGGLLLISTPHQRDGGPPDPAWSLRHLLGSGTLGAHYAPVHETERLWVLRDNHYRFFAYRLDCLVARKLRRGY